MSVLAAALLAGCGGGAEGEESLSKAEFLKQGNALCAKARKSMRTEIEDAFKKVRKNPDAGLDSLNSLVTDIVVPGLEEEIEGLEGLGAPSGEEEKVDEIIDSIQVVVDDATADAKAFSVSDTDPYAKAAEKANAYGLDNCGSPNRKP